MRTLALAVLLGSLATFSVATPPTQEQVTALTTAMTQAAEKLSGDADAVNQAAAKAAEGLALDELTLEQIKAISATRLLDYAPVLLEPIAARLQVLGTDKTAAGAAALEMSLQTAGAGLLMDDEADQREYASRLLTRLDEVMAHPAIGEHLRRPGTGRNLFVTPSMMSEADMAALTARGTLAKISELITTDLNTEGTAALGALVEPMLAPQAAVPAALRTATLEKIKAACAAAIAREGAVTDANRKRLLARIKDNMTLADSAFARGELIGGPAPQIAFDWVSPGAFAGESVTTLSDLKGKVVLVDFWATWCGPCIRAFPAVRALQERYKDYDVVILGVTSLQGYHIQRKGEERTRIETADDPAKERQLMPEFMADLEMTWPVVFSQASVFNPEYGVRGIPHLTLIDPAGKVRYNALRPGEAAEEAEKIDALLREFKLRVPDAPMD
jgi:thiol-disulfide isomerase/thioredoxin